MALPPPHDPLQNPLPQPALPLWLQRANTLGLTDNETVLYELMVNFLNFTENQYICLRDQGGYGKLRDLNQWKHKDIRDWCNTMSTRPATRGRRTFGDLKIKQLQGIAWWVTDCILRNIPLDVDVFKANEEEFRANAAYAYLEKEADDVSIDKPEKFEYKNWIAWEESVYMYFDSLLNLRGVPLVYVIRKDTPPGTDKNTFSRKDQIIHNSPLQGFVFDMDTKTVLSVLKECTLGTEAETWIKNIKCGRVAMQALQRHYDGTDEARKRLDTAKAQLDKTFYRHEATFSFEKFVTALNSIYTIHDRYNEPIYESDKVRYLLDKCQNNHTEFKQAVMLCRTMHDTFPSAVTYLKTEVGRLFPDGGRGGRKRQIANANSIKKKKNIINGVDCSDLSRWFEPSEFQKLPGYMRKRIAMNKDHRSKNQNQIQKHKKARVNAVSFNNNTEGEKTDDNQNRLVAAMINGVINANRHESTSSSVQFPHNGRNATIAAISTNGNNNRNTSSNESTTSAVTFDHLGNPL